MAFFGLITRREHAEMMEALKADFMKNLPKFLLETADVEKWNLPNPAVYENQADLFRKLSWVLQAVDITASAAALTPLSVKRIVSGVEPKKIPHHEFEMLLLHPNPLDSRYEFLYGTISMMMLTGNAYWYLSCDSENEPPSELWLIPSHMIEPIPDGRMYIRGYKYNPGNGTEIFLEKWQICHFRRFNPFSRFVGLSAIESIAMTSQMDLAMQEWNTKFFGEYNARLPGILTFEQMIADTTWDDIKKNTREASKKRELLMLRGVGQGAVQWMQNAVSQKEMEFLNGRMFNRDEIWNTLAPGMVSMLSENATEANSRTGAAVFNERTIYPKHILISQKVTNEILPRYGGRPLLCEFDDIRVVDRQLQMDEQRLYSESHTIAEIRKKYYNEEPLGDERDELFPSQVTASAVQPADAEFNNDELERNTNEQKITDEEKEKEKQAQATKAVLDELGRWERKALRLIGKKTEFISDTIPEYIVKYVEKRLPGCLSETAVKAVFDTARRDVMPQPPEAELVLRGLIETLRTLR